MSIRTSPAALGAVLVAIATLNSGCAALFSKPAPELSALRPNQVIDCTDTYGANVADVLLGLLAAGTGGLGVAVGAGVREGGLAALGAVGVIGGISHWISAATTSVGRCRELKAMQADGRLAKLLGERPSTAAAPSAFLLPVGTTTPQAVPQLRSATPMVLELETDRAGSDYRGFTLEVGDASTCLAACQQDSRCGAFTYVAAGVQGIAAKCRLKEGMPQPRKATGFTSGTK